MGEQSKTESVEENEECKPDSVQDAAKDVETIESTNTDDVTKDGEEKSKEDTDRDASIEGDETKAAGNGGESGESGAVSNPDDQEGEKPAEDNPIDTSKM